MGDETKATKPPFLAVFTNLFRAIARPAIAIMFAAGAVQMATQGVEAPEWFTRLLYICVLWYFGDRTVQHLREKKEEK